MTSLANTFECGTNGTTITAGNSGSTCGDAVAIGNSTGSANIFDNTLSSHGSLSCKLTSGSAGGTSFVQWASFNDTSFVFRFYVYFDTLPSAAIRLLDIRSASATVLRINVTAANKFQTQEGAGATTALTAATAFAAKTWYRLEVEIDVISATVGQYSFDYYKWDDVAHVDPTLSSSAGNIGTANITTVNVGHTTSGPTSFPLWIDDIAGRTGTTRFGAVEAAASLVSHGVATFAAPLKRATPITMTAGGHSTTTFGMPVARAATIVAHGVSTTTMTATVSQRVTAHGVATVAATAKAAWKPTVVSHGVAATTLTAKVNRPVTVVAHGVATSTVTLKVARPGTIVAHGIATVAATMPVAKKSTMTAHGQGNLIPTGKVNRPATMAAHGVAHVTATVGVVHMLVNTFEGGTNGTAMTGSNTGGSSGDALGIGTSTGALQKFDSAIKAHGGMSGKFTTGTSGGPSFGQWTISQTTETLRGYIYFDTLPSVAVRLVDIRSSTGSLLRLNLDATHHFQTYEGGSGTTHSVATAVSAGVWYRFEIDLSVVSATVATYKFDYYLLDSATHVEPGVAVTGSGNTGTGTITTINWGSSAAGAPNSWVCHLDDLAAIGPSTGAYIGPYTNPVYGNIVCNGKGLLQPATPNVKRASTMVSHGAGFMLPNLGRLKLTINAASHFTPTAKLTYKANLASHGFGRLWPTSIPPPPPQMGFFVTDIKPYTSVKALVSTLGSVKIDMSTSGYVGILGVQNFIVSGSLFDSVTSTTVVFSNQLITVTWTEAGYFASGTIVDIAGDTVVISGIQIELASTVGFGVPNQWDQEVISIAPGTAKLAITGGAGK